MGPLVDLHGVDIVSVAALLAVETHAWLAHSPVAVAEVVARIALYHVLCLLAAAAFKLLIYYFDLH